ncbi:MAG: phosphoadenylyl-sulfate reductase [Verrucomicrobia bacterium]|nr:phosphoadenylyl-sulfate reductase [Verrucomicrobiota bacterium]
MLTAAEIHALNRRFEHEPTEKVLAWAAERFGARAAIGTSFQGAGLVMMHLAKTHGIALPVFTLDTGLLFPETLQLKRDLEALLEIQIEAVQPDLTVEQQEEAQGPKLWKRDPDLCCTIRKVLPLQGKLGELDCWITGLRRQQSEARSQVSIVEVYVFDEATRREIVKLNPMAHWTREAVWQYLREHEIPYNPLNDQGYRSIGCWPCTRKTSQGDHERAGRWTGFKKVECGIHTFMSKKADFEI